MIDLDFLVDMDAIGELAGTVSGLEDSYQDRDYLDNLAHHAHNETTHEFDLAAASAGMAGKLTHVFEFGVPGITEGTGGPPDPTSQAARLYMHELVGHGGMYQTEYVFRPAVVPNPKPTVARTGVASRYLRHISKRKYIFKQRAMVMETGMEVEITPKRGRFLFVPFYGEQPRDPRNKRGYMMWNKNLGPIVSRPGQTTVGTFQTFWEGWWRATGDPLMSDVIDDDLAFDVRSSLELAATRSKNMKLVDSSASAAIVQGTSARARRRAFSTMKSKAAARRGWDRK